MPGQYDKKPYICVPEGENRAAWQGYEDIGAVLLKRLNMLKKKKILFCVECYHGVREDEIIHALEKYIKPALLQKTREAFLAPDLAEEKIRYNLTDDRVFGILSHHTIHDFIDHEQLENLRKKIAEQVGVTVVVGTGASLLGKADILIYADMARWEIQQRYRSGEMPNWLSENYNEEILRKYKRAFFIDWRIMDRHKQSLYAQMDYILDTNTDIPKMMTAEAFFAGLKEAIGRPFRLVPYFDPGVWGGQWMKEKMDLDPDTKNYAWSFDCVPEENSLLMKVGDVLLETPAINLVFTHPDELLGPKVHARFGREFPIRFDMLDTIDGQNLSLQVHPMTEYIQDVFGMHYTQDESYYILDTKGENACVYLGCKTGVTADELRNALQQSTKTGVFEAEKYVNVLPAHRHDHFLIPAGTLHCSGKNCMVLEISATPYIFTFKLWDWGRLGLDGKPRPIHLEHGMNNIQMNRDTELVLNELAYQSETVFESSLVREERTGLHALEFIETRRTWFAETVHFKTNRSVNVLNLVEGASILVESEEGAFQPFIVHYAETFIVPAAVEHYSVRPLDYGTSDQCAVIRAYVRL